MSARLVVGGCWIEQSLMHNLSVGGVSYGHCLQWLLVFILALLIR